jgi:hypothetical protein
VLKKIIFSILFLLTGLSSYGQYGGYGRVQNLVQADNKPYHFGFILGLNSMDFNVSHSGVVDENGRVWFGEQTGLSPGFTVGIISDLRLASWLNLRFTPVLLFGDRKLTFIDDEGVRKSDIVSVRSTLLYFPLLVKVRGQRYGNYRPYLIGGISTTLDLGRQRENVIMLNPYDYGIEFGVGFDFYLPYFKLAPEFKMFLGFNDMLERDRPEIANGADLKYTDAIHRLTSRLFILSFNFE